MPTDEELIARKQEVLRELASLNVFRRGSVVQHTLQRTRKDGTRTRRGPYFLYTYKEGGKTLSRHLKSPAEAEAYRSEIRSFRRFQELTKELRCIGETLSDHAHQKARRDAEWSIQKKTRNASLPNRRKSGNSSM